MHQINFIRFKILFYKLTSALLILTYFNIVRKWCTRILAYIKSLFLPSAASYHNVLITRKTHQTFTDSCDSTSLTNIASMTTLAQTRHIFQLQAEYSITPYHSLTAQSDTTLNYGRIESPKFQLVFNLRALFYTCQKR